MIKYTVIYMIKFNSNSKKYKELSNVYDDECMLIFNGKKFKSGEHIFNYNKYMIAASVAMKNNNALRSKDMIECAKRYEGDEYERGYDARIKSRVDKKLTEEEKSYWESLYVDIQYRICVEKITKSTKIKELLKDSKNDILLNLDNVATEKTFWGGKTNKKDMNEIIGKNTLGKIWMKIRTEHAK